MRTLVKVIALSTLGLLAACSGADDGGVAQGSTEEGSGPAAQAPGASAEGDRAGDINALVASAGHLSTDKKADLEPVKTGDAKTLEVPGEGGTTMLCTQTPYSLTKVPEKFVALNPNADVLWPGSLVQGKSMAGGILDPIPVKRAPGTITLTLSSGGGGPFFKKMEEPSLSAATQAQNEILESYTGATPAKFSYSYSSIYSSEQLKVAVAANVEGTNWSAAGSLDVSTDDTKSRFLIQFTQEYYTMAFDPPQGAAGVFAPSVTSKDLEPYAAAGNPPVYVASVTYGRIFYILFESSASQTSLEAAVSGSYNSGSINATASASADWKKTINESKVVAYGLGGNAEQAIGAVTGTDQFDKIAKFLTTGANFDKNNPGVPISYTIRHLTDASQVKLALTTEYNAKNCVPSTVGCDGVKGSGKTLDACGVCGGTATTCDCAGRTIQHKASNGAYVNFTVPTTATGQSVSFPDGHWYEYHFGSVCHQVNWGSIRFVCNKGNWAYDGTQSFSSSARCDPDSNSDWSSNGASISCGYAP